MALQFEYQYAVPNLDALRAKIKSIGGSFRQVALTSTTEYTQGNAPLQIRIRHDELGLAFTIKENHDNKFQPDATIIKHELHLEPTKKNINSLETMLGLLGCTVKLRVEKIREAWDILVLDRTQLVKIFFDTYPGCPTYLQVQALNQSDLIEITKMLNLYEVPRLETTDLYNYFYGIDRDRKFKNGGLTFANALTVFNFPTEEASKRFAAKLEEQRQYIKTL